MSATAAEAAIGLGKCSKICHIIRLRQLLQRWRNKARLSSAFGRGPVPAGHVAVYVGPRRRRFVFPAAYLNHPVFRELLAQIGEMYGFDRQGPLTFPCEEAVVEAALRSASCRFGFSGELSFLRRHCHGGAGRNLALCLTNPSGDLTTGRFTEPVVQLV